MEGIEMEYNKIEDYFQGNPLRDLESLQGDDRTRREREVVEHLRAFVHEVEYLTFLIKSKEIENDMIINYYADKIIPYFRSIERYYKNFEQWNIVDKVYYHDRFWIGEIHKRIPPWGGWRSKGISHNYITGKTLVTRTAPLRLLNFLRIIPKECDILDCKKAPIFQCEKCQNHYCSDHIDSHDHDAPIRTLADKP